MKARGFTLVEMMASVVVIGVLATMSVPSLKSLQQSNQRLVALKTMRHDLAQARELSFGLTEPGNQEDCEPWQTKALMVLAARGKWENGRHLYRDTPGRHAPCSPPAQDCAADPGECDIATQPALPRGWRVESHLVVCDGDDCNNTHTMPAPTYIGFYNGHAVLPRTPADSADLPLQQVFRFYRDDVLQGSIVVWGGGLAQYVAP